MSSASSPYGRFPVEGAGLGLRTEFWEQYIDQPPAQVDFLEVAPENWMGVGGVRGRKFREFSERFPVVCHGLSLSIGGPAPLDEDFLKQLKTFLDRHDVRVYTEHLSYCGDSGQLYDLMPIPHSQEAVTYVADRIRRVQDILERRIGMENVSTYAAPASEMAEVEFVNAVLEEADCGLHLDVNNIYVNAINHGFDAHDYLARLPGERILYAHIAGHLYEAEDLRVDTHGEDVIPEVWKLLDSAYEQFGVFPTLLERDFNIPPLEELLKEVDRIAAAQQRALGRERAHVA
ncbi:MAG: DUF692 domain-containing protein [Gammaproteobacteria bacterium]